jgi:hypothetical protein
MIEKNQLIFNQVALILVQISFLYFSIVKEQMEVSTNER